MFTLDHHRKIVTILESLDSELLKNTQTYFGGGTLLSLKYGEYRLSKDIDFICPVTTNGYRELRKALHDKGESAIFTDQSNFAVPRGIKADQYGIRCGIVVDSAIIKFEIIAEARIELGNPEWLDWCPVATLNFSDSCAEKLLANADRWLDKSIESRDLIDLAILRLQNKIPQSALDKAESAYPVITPLTRALSQFMGDQHHQNRCFKALQVKDPGTVMEGINLLFKDLSPLKS